MNRSTLLSRHQPQELVCATPGCKCGISASDPLVLCMKCGKPFPCPTIRRIEEDQ